MENIFQYLKSFKVVYFISDFAKLCTFFGALTNDVEK